MDIIAIIFGLPLLFFLPGYLLVRCRESVVRSFSDIGEMLFASVLISILISTVLGLFLVLFSFFNIYALIALCALVSLVAALIALREGGGLRFKLPCMKREETLFLIGLILVAALLYFHPFEYVVGGRDPGIYINSGVDLAITGDWYVYDEVLPTINTEALPYFNYERHLLAFYYYHSFYTIEIEEGLRQPQFYPVYPLWIANFYGMFGLDNFLFVTPVLSIISLTGFFFLCRRIIDLNAAVMSSIFLLFMFTQVWWSYYPNSEVMSQLMFWGSLFLAAVSFHSNSRTLGVIAGIGLGLTLIIKFEYLLITIPLISFFLLEVITSRKTSTSFAFYSSFAVSSTLSFCLAMIFCTVYVEAIFGRFYGILLNYKEILILCSVMLATYFILYFVISKIATRIKNKSTSILKNVRFVVLVLFSICIVYLIVRSIGAPPESQAANPIKLTWYVGPPLFILGLLGIGFSIRKFQNRAGVILLIVAISFLIFFLFSAGISPDHPWWSRRYSAIVIPALCLFGAYFIANIFQALKKRVGKVAYRTVQLSLCLLILLPIIVPTSILLVQNEYWQGAIENTEQIAELIPTDGILLYQENFCGDFAGILYATPLECIFDRHSMIIKQYSDEVGEQINKWINDGKVPMLLTPINIDFEKILEDFDLSYAGQFTNELILLRYETQALSPSYAFINHTHILFFIHHKNQSNDNAQIENFLNYSDDVLLYMFGWYNIENDTGIPKRWIENNATLYIYSPENRTANLSFQIAAFYQPRTLEIYAGEVLVTHATIPNTYINLNTMINLNKGSNYIRFHVVEGCEKPCEIPEMQSEDCRCLSLAIRNITVT